MTALTRIQKRRLWLTPRCGPGNIKSKSGRIDNIVTPTTIYNLSTLRLPVRRYAKAPPIICIAGDGIIRYEIL